MTEPRSTTQPAPPDGVGGAVGETGGEAACALHRVCDACGALEDGPPPPVCGRCGAPRGG